MELDKDLGPPDKKSEELALDEQKIHEKCICGGCGHILATDRFPKGVRCPYCGSKRRITKAGQMPHQSRVTPMMVLGVVCVVVLVVAVAMMFSGVNRIKKASVTTSAPKTAAKSEKTAVSSKAETISPQTAAPDTDSTSASSDSIVTPAEPPAAEDATELAAPPQPEIAAGILAGVYRRENVWSESFETKSLDAEKWTLDISDSSTSECKAGVAISSGLLKSSLASEAEKQAASVQSRQVFSGDFDLSFAYA